MKPLLAGILWFVSVWGLVNAASYAFGVPEALGPVLGLATGLIVWRDPRHAFWGRGQPTPAMRERLARINGNADTASAA